MQQLKIIFARLIFSVWVLLVGGLGLAFIIWSYNSLHTYSLAKSAEQSVVVKNPLPDTYVLEDGRVRTIDDIKERVSEMQQSGYNNDEVLNFLEKKVPDLFAHGSDEAARAVGLIHSEEQVTPQQHTKDVVRAIFGNLKMIVVVFVCFLGITIFLSFVFLGVVNPRKVKRIFDQDLIVD